MGLESAPQRPLNVSAREFDLGRPNIEAPNVQALADAVRQGYIGASEIQKRALEHPTLVAEAAAGPQLVQAKLAAAQSETSPEMLKSKVELATANAQKAKMEAEILAQTQALGNVGQSQLKYLREKGVLVEDMTPEGIAREYGDYKQWEISKQFATAAQQRAVKSEHKVVGDKPMVFLTSNGMPLRDEKQAPALNAAAEQGAIWNTRFQDFSTWQNSGKPTFDFEKGGFQTQSVSGAPSVSTPVETPAAAATPQAPPAEDSGRVWNADLGAWEYKKPLTQIPGEQVGKAGTAEMAVKTAMDMNRAYTKLVATRKKMLGPVMGRAAKLALAKEWNAEVAAFQQTATALLAPVAKGIFNETGVLSDKDVARYESVFPSLFDTPEVGLQKLASITKTILGSYRMSANNWKDFGYDPGKMIQKADQAEQEARALYKQFGLDLDSGSTAGALFEAFETGRTYKGVDGKTYAQVPGGVVLVPEGFRPPSTTKPAPASKPLKPGEEYTFPVPTGAVQSAAPEVEPRGTNKAPQIYTPFK